MSRDEQDRDDLLAEATALVERIELATTGVRESIIVGFRRDGSPSLFFDADPVYQFNSHGELRRAFVGGLLYKASAGQLVALNRVRSESEVALVRRDLSAEEQTAFLVAAESRLESLRDSVARRDYRVVGQVPADRDVMGRIADWLSTMELPIRVARSPRVS